MFEIRLDDGVREMLDEYVVFLSMRLGRCVDYSEALLFLLRSRRRYPALLIDACRPVEGVEEDKKKLLLDREKAEARGSL